MPGIEKIVSITRLPPMMLVNMGTMMFINGSRELRIPWFKVACRSVSPLVLARSMKSELMVSASSALKYLVTRAMGPKAVSYTHLIGVMYYGKLVEMADSDELFKNPMHPYTRALLSAIPEPDPINEKKRKKIHYDPEMHRYGDGNQPSYHEIAPGHTVYCSDEEFEEIKKQWKA